MWQNVVIGDKRGELTTDPAVVEEIHQRLAGLTSYEELYHSLNKF
jgi:hypothetical protein